MSAFKTAQHIASKLRALDKAEAKVHASVKSRYDAKRAEWTENLTDEVRLLLEAAQKADAPKSNCNSDPAENLDAQDDPEDEIPPAFKQPVPPVGGLEVDRETRKSRRV